jgi:hypothetical protein
VSAVRLGEHEVLSGTIDLPLVGLWVAEDVELDTDDPPAVGDRVGIEVVAASGETIAFRGTVRSASEYHARARLFVVGGAGGLGETITAQHYTASPTVLQIVEDILRAQGEALSSTVDAATLATLTVPSWMRAEGVAASALRLIADAIGWDWRVLADGTVWLGVRTWAEVTGALAASLYDLAANPAEQSVTYADAETLLPGHTVQGRKVYRVEHTIGPRDLRTRATLERLGRDDWERAVRQAVPELAYLRTYEARVVGQNADGTLEVQAYDPAIGGLSRVPVRLGLPGCAVTVAAGARVDLGFEEARPDKAYAGLWNTSAALVDVTLSGSGSCAVDDFADVTVLGGTQEVARVDDSVLWATALWDAATTTLYLSLGDLPAPLYSIALVGLGSVTGILPNPNTPAPPSPGTPGTPLSGAITSGASGFFA